MRCQRHFLFRSSLVDPKKNDDRQWQQPISLTEKGDFFIPSLLLSPNVMALTRERSVATIFRLLFYSIILSAQVKSFSTCLFIPWRSFKRVKSLLLFPDREKRVERSFFSLLRDVKRLNKRIQKKRKETLSKEWKNIRWTDQRSEKKDLSLDGWLCMERLSDERLPWMSFPISTETSPPCPATPNPFKFLFC